MRDYDRLKILPVGTILIAKKNQFMESSGEQWLTSGKEYTIIREPYYYKYPIEIIDDQGYSHSCPVSAFSHVKP